MSMTDPIADMITRIRNGQRAFLSFTCSPYSKFRVSILESLKIEGYIKDFSVFANNDQKQEIKIELKYYDGEPVIKKITKISTPGKRCYSSIKDLPKYYNGLGIVIISTPKGIMSDHEARKVNLGGELLCSVF